MVDEVELRVLKEIECESSPLPKPLMLGIFPVEADDANRWDLAELSGSASSSIVVVVGFTTRPADLADSYLLDLPVGSAEE